MGSVSGWMVLENPVIFEQNWSLSVSVSVIDCAGCLMLVKSLHNVRWVSREITLGGKIHRVPFSVLRNHLVFSKILKTLFKIWKIIYSIEKLLVMFHGKILDRWLFKKTLLKKTISIKTLLNIFLEYI